MTQAEDHAGIDPYAKISWPLVPGHTALVVIDPQNDFLSDDGWYATQGVDVGQLMEQLLGYLRDLMVASVGAPAEVLLYVAPGEREGLIETASGLGCETILAMLQILDQTLARMRVSTQRRTLAELALVRSEIALAGASNGQKQAEKLIIEQITLENQIALYHARIILTDFDIPTGRCFQVDM